MRNQVQLITYADRLAGSMAGLADLLQGPLAGLFGGVHVLPFFDPIDGSDAGFDPIDHTRVDPRVGDWADVERLGDHVEVMADLIVNHVSAASAPFRDFLARGDASATAGMFLTFDRVFPAGATEHDLLAVYRPRPGLPFTAVTLADGSKRLVWTTFGSGQIDLDVHDPEARAYLDGVLETFAAHGVRLVRLDAVGYTAKVPGTSCFMVPETFAFVDDLTEQARRLGLEVLVEVHSYYRHQIAVAAEVDRVYDFALPPLLLHALYTGDEAPLAHWLAVRPANAVTVLDTHDGIGVIDVGPDPTAPERPGLLTLDQLGALVEGIHERSGGSSRLATGAAASNLDLYQVNCTFYDALGADDERYLLARLVQFLVPGVPQVYYVGLLAGRNDVDRLRRTGVGRDINRHRYTPAEVAEALERPVVRALLAAIRLRTTHPAFAGTFAWSARPGGLVLEWRHAEGSVRLDADLAAGRFTLAADGPDGAFVASSVADLIAAIPMQ